MIWHSLGKRLKDNKTITEIKVKLDEAPWRYNAAKTYWGTEDRNGRWGWKEDKRSKNEESWIKGRDA